MDNLYSATIDKFCIIREILFLGHGSTLLYHINKKPLLYKILKKSNIGNDFRFYKDWFINFMLPDAEQNSVLSDEDFKYFLKEWTDSFAKNWSIVTEILKLTDQWIEKFGKNKHATYFIQHVVNFSFQQGIYSI